MTSYAAVAAHHTDGPQPKPDPALLNLEPTVTELPDVDSKVTIVEPGFKEHPAVRTPSPSSYSADLSIRP